MRVLQILGGSDVDGVKKYIVSQAQALSECCEVCVVSLCEDPAPGAAADGLCFNIAYSASVQEIERIAGEFTPDVLYCCGSRAFSAYAQLKKQLAVPAVAEVRSEEQLTRKEYQSAIRKFDFYLPVSEQIAKHMIQQGFDPETVFFSASQGDPRSCAEHVNDCCATAMRRFALPDKKRNGIVICGAYGRGNTGDDAILRAIVQELREIDPDRPITIVTRSPDEARLQYRANAIHTFRIDQMIQCFRKASVYINGGGSLIQDVTSSRSLRYYLLTLSLAKKCGCRVMMYGCGIGPLQRPGNRKKAAHIINRSVDMITLRDRLSFDELKRMGIDRPEIHMSADPAFRLTPASRDEIKTVMKRLGIPEDAAFIGVGVRDWKNLSRVEEDIAAALDYAYERYGLIPLFIPIEYPADIGPAERISKRLHCPHYLVWEQQNIAVTIGFLAQTEVVVGIRLHSLLFSASVGVPVIGISYDIKVDGFLDYIKSDTCVPFHAVTKERLEQLIDRCVSQEKKLAVQKAAQSLRELEKENMRAVRRLLEQS